MKQLTLFLFTLSISVLSAIDKPPTQITVKENIPVIITKPITHVPKIDTTVSKKETQGLCPIYLSAIKDMTNIKIIEHT